MAQGSPATEEKSDRTKAREAFFLEFAHAIRSHFPKLPLMVTGGFRTRSGMEAAVSGAEAGCDLVGIARPAAADPAVPNKVIFNKDVKDEDAKLVLKTVPVPKLLTKLMPGVGAGAASVSLPVFLVLILIMMLRC